MQSRPLASLTAAAVLMLSLLAVASVHAAPIQLTQSDYNVCSTMTDGCLVGVAIEGTRTFSTLPAGTTIWAARASSVSGPPTVSKSS